MKEGVLGGLVGVGIVAVIVFVIDRRLRKAERDWVAGR